MKKIIINMIYTALLVAITACNKTNSTDTEKKSANMIAFVTTQDSQPLVISSEMFDSVAAKEFITSGKNLYIANPEAIEKGKKLFQLYSCTQCHGPDARGQVGPSLIGPDYRYPKDASNKGMFETIWHGTNGGMGAKGKGLMDTTDPQNGLSPDELLKIIAWIRSHGSATGNP